MDKDESKEELVKRDEKLTKLPNHNQTFLKEFKSSKRRKICQHEVEMKIIHEVTTKIIKGVIDKKFEARLDRDKIKSGMQTRIEG